jgi:hypothetical protein
MRADFVPTAARFASFLQRMLALPLAITLALSGHEISAVERHAALTAKAAEREAATMRSLVKRGDPAAVAYVIRAVGDGLPPPALRAFLEAARHHPQPAYKPRLRELASYRSASIRAGALVALAALDEHEARLAVLAALGDPDIRIRLLGLEMAETFTTPELEEASMRLLDRDAELAAIRRGTAPRSDR